MKIQNEYFRALVTSLICTAAAAAIIIPLQTWLSNTGEEKLLYPLLSESPAQLDIESESRRAFIKRYDEEVYTSLSAIRYLIETEGQEKAFERIADNIDVIAHIFLVKEDGTIINGIDHSSKGRKLSEICCLPPEEYRNILESDGNACSGNHRLEDGNLFKVYAIPYDGIPGNVRLVAPLILKGKYASIYSIGDMGGMFGTLDERSLITLIDNTTQTLISCKTNVGDFSGLPISTIGLDESVTLSPCSGHSEAAGLEFSYKTVQYSSDVLGDLTILALYTDQGAAPIEPLLILLAAILLITFLLRLYSFYIDEEPGKLQLRVGGLRPFGRKGRTVDTEKARILFPFAFISIVVVTAVGFYLNSLNMVGNQCWTSVWNIRQLSDNLSKLDHEASVNFETETEDEALFMKITSCILEGYQEELLNCKDASRLKKVKDGTGAEHIVEICNPWLHGLAQSEGAFDISIFDGDGTLVSTSGTWRNLRFTRDNPETATIFDVIDGISESRMLVSGEYLLVSVPFLLRRGGETVDAMLVSRFNADMLEPFTMIESITNTFNSASESWDCHFLMTTAGNERKVIYSPEVLSQSVSNMPDVIFTNGHIGFHKVNETKYFVTTKITKGSRNDYALTSFIPLSIVFAGRTEITILTFIVTFLIIMALLIVLLVYGHNRTEELRMEADREIEERKVLSEIQLGKILVEMKKAPSSSQRILGIMKKIWLIVLAIVTIVFIRGITSGHEESLSGYLMSFGWQRGINIFSLTSMLIITMSFAFALFLLTKLMSIIGKALNAGTETVCQLIVSLLRYAGYIAVVFVTLYMFGVDTTGVLASLGAFSVMVGLGAKNLITDILAGISIIMEKNYKVGDIVEIDEFCGKVAEIGIRTTKVEDIEGNVKIFYNSGLDGVVNMTSRLSSVRLDVKLHSQHSFTEVEDELKKFFIRISNKYPQIKGDCSYLGVQESSPTYNIFRISVPCDEIDRAPMRRALNKEFSEFCTEENLNRL